MSPVAETDTTAETDITTETDTTAFFDEKPGWKGSVNLWDVCLD
jgi:hypothetical protein